MQKTLHSKAYKRLTELLRAARKEANLTQQGVAERLGKQQSFVAKYENGERRLDVLEFVAVAEAIGADPASILADLSTLENDR